MTPYRRNVLLGATVVVALAVLAWMILQFGANVARPFAPATIKIRFVSDRADGVADGSPITYRGVDSGHVTKVWIDTETREKVYFDATVNRNPRLPKNIVGVIKTASLLGSGSAVALETDGKPSTEPLEEHQLIQARFVGLGDVLPSQFGELAGEMTKTVRKIRESNLVEDLDAQVKNAGKVIESIQSFVSDEQTRGDLKQSIANLREVTDNAKQLSAKLDRFADDLQKTNAQASTAIAKTGDNIESLSRQMGDRLTQVAKLLDQFQSIAEKVNAGQGTAGQLVNDPKLYQSLVDTSRDLNATIKDFKRLVEQWEQEGVTLKLK